MININVLILICKCNHGDFKSYDLFSCNFIADIAALKIDWFQEAFA